MNMTKGKKIAIVAGILFLGFCLKNFVQGYNDDNALLPTCDNPEVIQKQIPGIIIKQGYKEGMSIPFNGVTISKPKQDEYDKEAGLRTCSAYFTLRMGNDVTSDELEYQIAFVGSDKKQYQVKVFF